MYEWWFILGYVRLFKGLKSVPINRKLALHLLELPEKLLRKYEKPATLDSSLDSKLLVNN